MSDTDAATEAARRGLWADTRFGWCNLRRHEHGPILARGSNWPETFGRLDARAQPASETIPPELQRPCPRCHAGIGERCHNYLGQTKFICPARLKPAAEHAEPLAVQPSLFDAME